MSLSLYPLGYAILISYIHNSTNIILPSKGYVHVRANSDTNRGQRKEISNIKHENTRDYLKSLE